MGFFNVEVTGLDSLDKDFEEHKKAIEKQIPTALGIVGAEMVKDLQAIIEGYFYRSYKPRHYQRSGQMKDDSSMDYKPENKTLTFTYSPQTTHNGLDAWVQDKPINGKFTLPRSADDLIIWGQHSHFDGTNHEIPARPFWNMFLEQQGNEKILDNFARGMLPKYKVVKEAGETVDLSEFALAADDAQVSIVFDNIDDEELPY